MILIIRFCYFRKYENYNFKHRISNNPGEYPQTTVDQPKPSTTEIKLLFNRSISYLKNAEIRQKAIAPSYYRSIQIFV